MVFYPILFLCVAALFAALLHDRFRIFATLGVTAGVYALALLAACLVRGALADSPLASHVGCGAGTLVFLIASLFLYTNNPLHKILVAMLCMANFSYAELFLPLFTGILPISAAGMPGALISIVGTLLIFALSGFCLYRPLQRFKARRSSWFVTGMTLALLVQYLLCLGKINRLLGSPSPYRRLLLATALFAVVVFCFRSVYHAGRFQSEEALQEARRKMMEMESVDYMDLLAAVREVRAAQKSGEYALDTVAQLLREGQTEKIPVYINMTKHNALDNPILAYYHDNPYLNAVIATKAAFAAQNDIDFQCNAATGDVPFTTAELCIMVNEFLTRACTEAAGFQGQRKLRFTAIPGEDALRLEAVYSGSLPEREKFSFQGKKFSDLMAWLFDDSPQEEGELRGLENAAEIALSHSGSLTVAGAGDEVILRAKLRY